MPEAGREERPDGLCEFQKNASCSFLVTPVFCFYLHVGEQPSESGAGEFNKSSCLNK